MANKQIIDLTPKVAVGTMLVEVQDAVGGPGSSGSVDLQDIADLAGAGINQLTGDVTAGPGTGAQAATIAALAVTTPKLANSGVTYGKMQNVSVASRLLGRGTAGGSAVREILLGPGLGMASDTVSAVATVSSAASSASPFAWNSDNFTQFALTDLANALTINADSGTPVDGRKVIFRLQDDGTARALTWTLAASKAFRAVGVTLPTTTVVNKVVYVGCIYNADADRWDAIAVAQEV